MAVRVIDDMSKHSPNMSRDLSDPSQMIQEVMELRGHWTMLSREVSGAHQNMTSTLHSLQADLRHYGERQSELVALQHEQVSHSAGLNRAFSAIEAHAAELVKMRESQDAVNKTIAERMTRFSGFLTGVVFIGGALIAALLWNYNLQKDVASNERAKLGDQIDNLDREGDARLDALEARK